jgi:hypothetical protein
MIHSLLREVARLGCEISCEGDKLKLHKPATLAPEHKELLKTNKADILEMFERQKKARALGWLVYPYGEAFERRIGRNSFVYIFQEADGTFTVWRGTWKDKKHAETEKVVIENADFKTAFERANNYLKWFLK